MIFLVDDIVVLNLERASQVSKHHLGDFEEFYTAVYKYIQDKCGEE